MDQTQAEFYGSLLDSESFQALQASVDRPLRQALRFNTLMVDPSAAAQQLSELYDWQFQPVPFCGAGFWVEPESENSSGSSLAKTVEFKMGRYYLQDAASMLPVELFAPSDEPLLTLDMAAAPGGKTTHLICHQKDKGLVIANDSSASRIPQLRRNLRHWGCANYAVTQMLGEQWGSRFPNTFDRVLLDAPCSGESLRQAARRKSRPISSKERERLQARQIRLLESGLAALKPGGELIYSTCTLHPDENEAVLDAVLKHWNGQVELAEPNLKLKAPGLVGVGTVEFNPTVSRAYRLWPHLYDTSGFFAALLVKTGSSADVEQVKIKSQQLNGYMPCNDSTRQELVAWYQYQYHLDLHQFLEEQELTLWCKGNHVVALPDRYLELFGTTKTINLGMNIAERKGERWIPSHELVVRFGDRMHGPTLELEL
ncbi:MAG: hypothetical protein ABFQ89_05190, partial [Chloroflexota bacterium]